ncbi:class I SAM-dependent methyltransferase [Actinoplanes xinjiangensis]|uniref:Phospholipid N-methyltransferase n=1 Tax=Actinoplanes xinjiangensis TaxID=512350 RepID=A0A316EVK3_9ACTN|nr:methyltransferase domain-containing protein [Actinoplanes xinjiangensis]PWK36042.1 phospholipid N-methyltransferase [Actinoplanes xinjiangensis]
MNSERGMFLREFLRHPMRTAAIMPSPPPVARNMAAAVPETGDPLVVELGPGTGPFTSEIQKRLRGRGRHVAVELNERFAVRLQRRYPELDVAVGDAVQLRQILDERGLGYADVIVSGLPHGLFNHSLQRRFMEAFQTCLAPDGRLTAYAYAHAVWSPPARHFHQLVHTGFAEVVTGRIHWTYFPPAYVYTARYKTQPHHVESDAPEALVTGQTATDPART